MNQTKTAPVVRTPVLEEARPATDLSATANWLKACLLGMTGAGKTQATITIPRIPFHDKEVEPKPLLLLDFDGRAATIANEPMIEVIPLHEPDPTSPKAWDKGERLRKELWTMARGGNFEYSGIIEEGLTTMGRIAMNSALLLDPKTGLGGAPAKQHYNPQIKFLVDHINSMRMLPCHYLITGHFDISEDADTGKPKYLPKITKSLKTEFPSWFNETYYAFRESGKGGKVHYYWLTAGTGLYDFFKSTLNNKQKFWVDPIEIDFEKEPVGFADLVERRFGK